MLLEIQAGQSYKHEEQDKNRERGLSKLDWWFEFFADIIKR